MIASWMMGACLALAGGVGPDGRSEIDSNRPRVIRPGDNPRGRRVNVPTGRLSARWIGQDGCDYVGPSPDPKPNDVQDIHIFVGGLSPWRDVAWVSVTGHGKHQWRLNTPQGSWGLAFRREARAQTADLFIEPLMVETGREFHIEVGYDDGAQVDLYFRGGRADPNLRMPEAALAIAWVGQDGHDQVGAGPGVGPDGFQDVRLALSNMSPRVDLKSAQIEGPGGLICRYGPDQDGYPCAEFVRHADDRTRANLSFQAAEDLAGRTFKLTLSYSDGKSDTATVVGHRTVPKLRMPPARLPNLVANAITGRWLGQDGSHVTGPGDVHIALDNLSANREVVAAVLSDSVQGLWVDRGDGKVAIQTDPGAAALGFRKGSDPFQADLFFPPSRDETGSMLTLRLIFRDGATTLVQLPGGPCDPLRLAPEVATTSTDAKPGDDLNDLCRRFGTVRLAPGTYPMARPLVLNSPVTLAAAAPGATLVFSQGTSDPEWTAAIKVHRGSTTLSGFAVRFAGPIRWRSDIAYGPAVIGTTDNHDVGAPADPKVGLTIAGLDLESPPAADPNGWVEAPRLLRLVGSQGGRIVGNRLRGGPIEFFGGPWQVVDNEYRGTPVGTVSPCVVAAHATHDLRVEGNRARPVGRSGKTWRFLVMTQRGAEDRVEDNVVEEIGPRDDDTIPWANAPEIILTESYRLAFEGKLAAVSIDGRVVKVPSLQGEAPLIGSVVAVVAGPRVGRWRRIAQVIDPTTYVLDSPLPPGSEWVSVTEGGFVNETFRGNLIDARGGSRASGLVLAGNHFGTKVLDNHLLGGEAFRIVASATERPSFWGWSHAPFFEGSIAENTIEDAEQGGVLGVEHSAEVRASRGRTYMSVTLRDNTVRWSETFLARHGHGDGPSRPPGLVVGYVPSIDPGELVVTEEGDRLQTPPATRPGVSMRVNAALFNGRATRDQGYALPAAPSTSASARAKILK